MSSWDDIFSETEYSGLKKDSSAFKLKSNSMTGICSTSFREEVVPLKDEGCNSWRGKLSFDEQGLPEPPLNTVKSGKEKRKWLKEMRRLRMDNQHQLEVMQMIMDKYRQHVSELGKSTKEGDLRVLATQKAALKVIEKERRNNIEKIEEMQNALKTVRIANESNLNKSAELVIQLKTENDVLRDLLAISDEANATLSLLCKTSEDKFTQTDNMPCEHLKMPEKDQSFDKNETSKSEEEDNEEYSSDDSGSFHSALGFDSDE